MGRTSRTSAMNQIFLRSALSRSSRLAMGPIRTSRAFTDPAVLAFGASLELGVSAWTLYIARACDWEPGIITAISMCHLGNVFNCLLGIHNELFSSGPTKASTAGMNAGTGGSYSSPTLCQFHVLGISVHFLFLCFDLHFCVIPYSWKRGWLISPCFWVFTLQLVGGLTVCVACSGNLFLVTFVLCGASAFSSYFLKLLWTNRL